MSADDLKILEEAFGHVTSLDRAARANFLAEFASDHPSLDGKLRALVAADEAGDFTLGHSINTSIKNLAESTPDPWLGRQLGHWTLEERIGAGGMGSVFLARRSDDQFAQRAALKVVAAQLTEAGASKRFLVERQILANLNHPNIAALYDGGTSPENVPFLVMEYVDGMRVDEYCDAQRLSIRDRLQLFLKVCDAVDYAHRNLVVHRDLKPNNILVAQGGEPKLLDFGIAKLLEPGSFDMTLAQTTAHSRAMTPEYASPEQVRGEPVSVAVDIYALGVLLYRLLAGQSPYGQDISTSHELEKAILERDPLRPSTVVTQTGRTKDVSGSEPSSVSESRGISDERLQRTLIGDLDNIVLKCLQKEPERRYASVREFSEDIVRFLSDQPVRARPNSWGYRSQKFLKRNAKPVAASMAVALGVVGLVTFYTLQLAAERDNAELAANRSDQIAQFLKNVFESANPAAAPGETITARMLLDSGLADIEDIADPMVKGALLRAMGNSYAELGDQDQAKALLEQSVALFRAEGETANLDLARSLNALADVDHQTFQLNDAVRRRTEAVALVRAAPGDDARELPVFLNGLATVYSQLQQHDKAIELWQEALALQRAGGTFGGGLTSDILGDLAVSYDNNGDYEQAIDTGLQALELSEAELGPLDPNTIVIINNLGLVSNRMGRYDKAAEFGTEAIARGEQLWAKDHWRLSFFRLVLAAHLRGLGEFEAANDSLTRAGSDIRRVEGEKSANYCAFFLVKGDHHRALGDFAKARDSYRKGLEASRSVFGEDSELALRNQIGLASALSGLGEHDDAENLLQDARKSRETLRRANQLQLDLELGKTITAMGRYVEARELLADTLASKESEVGLNNPALLPFLKAKVQVYLAAGDTYRALTSAERAFKIAQDSLPENNWLAAMAQADWGSALIAAGRTREGREALGFAIQDLSLVLPADHPHIRAVSQQLESSARN